MKNYGSTSLLYQIFFDEHSRAKLSPGFIGLDNSDGPVWLYEIYPIYKFLGDNKSSLDKKWLGFFSTKFGDKTKLSAPDIRNTIELFGEEADVLLFSSYWYQVAGSLNVWQHGEHNHPGLLEISQLLADKSGYQIDLRSSITTLNTGVFSNYFVAQVEFWREWYRVVNIYLQLLERSKEIRKKTVPYQDKIVPIHTFVLERIPSMILLSKKFKSYSNPKHYHRQNPFGEGAVEFMLQMDHSKNMYLKTNDKIWLKLFNQKCGEFNKKFIK